MANAKCETRGAGTQKIDNSWKDYSINTFGEDTYRHHPNDLSDPTVKMTLLEIIKYRNRKDN